jgi:membrane protein DedA with SNARE-associated domain/rhodanese-related sulfurtransferase
VEQLGLPVSALPGLMAMGALTAAGHFSFTGALAAAFAGSAIADTAWYLLGRWRGHAIIRLLCRISLEPDTCVRRTLGAFDRLGAWTLAVAKFLPGLSLIAPPLAGAGRFHPLWFQLCNGAGIILWAGGWMLLGYLFHAQMEVLALWGLRLGTFLIVLLAAPLAVYIALKYLHRRRFLRLIHSARVSAEELALMLESPEPPTVIDLRHPDEIAADGAILPGALRIPPAELERRRGEIPADRDVVLYCNCPGEAASAAMALKLHRLGVTRARPLAGGLDGWRADGRPVAAVGPATPV